ncbi:MULTISPECIES: hypothetical protein [Paenarthrobacter]|uniref:hypothetical protein n=1 Tax=Paenarthrobacter TaxID=1742992 RepID=UPI00222E5D16|nr:hypothetical protein [Paenarthrobacter sp. PAE-2]MCW3767243.1 hypothetical protein [Paenarthrobacter sp. PAE-2]
MAAKNAVQEEAELLITVRAAAFNDLPIMSAQEFVSGLEQQDRRVQFHASGGRRLHEGATAR